MATSKKKPKTVFEAGLIPDTDEGRESLRNALAARERLSIPSLEVVVAAASRLNTVAKSGQIEPKHVLKEHNRLIVAAMDVVCGEVDANGNPCGGFMDLYVDAVSKVFVCQKNSSHRFPA